MRRWMILAGLLAIVAGLLWHIDRFDFIGDDAYISFRYAENLVRHGDLTWNPGERPVEGYTNFLWTLLLAAGLSVGVVPERLAPVLGALFGVLGLLALYWLGRVLAGAGGPDPRHPTRRLAWYRELLGGRAPPTGWALLPPGITAAWGTYACWSSGGLETPLFAFLTLAGITQYLREEVVRSEDAPQAPPLPTSFLWFALAALTRPEGALVFAVVGAHRLSWTLASALVSRVRSGREAARALLDGALQWNGLWVVGFLALYGAYFAWRYEHYGFLYPNTYYVKIATTSPAATRAQGWAYLHTFVRDYHLLRYAPALLLAWLAPLAWWRESALMPPRILAWGLHRLGFLWSLLLPLGAVIAWHVARFGGDFMAMHRFLAPWVGALALLIGLAARGLWELPLDPLLRRLPAPLRAGAMLLPAALLVGLFAQRSTALDRRTLRTLRVTPTGYEGAYDGMESVAFMRKFAQDRVKVGRWLRAHVKRPGALMAVGGAGAIVYHSKLRAIDSFGLSDLWIAHHARPVSHRPGHQKRAPLHYILSRKPDILCYPGLVRLQSWEYRPPRHERRRWARRGYRYFCATPAGLTPSHYCCLYRVGRGLGLHPVSAYDEARGARKDRAR